MRYFKYNQLFQQKRKFQQIRINRMRTYLSTTKARDGIVCTGLISLIHYKIAEKFKKSLYKARKILSFFYLDIYKLKVNFHQFYLVGRALILLQRPSTNYMHSTNDLIRES